MNSDCIYVNKSDRTPYFYIIQHIESGKYYAGAKWGAGADPSTFMTTDGYCTSSPSIRRIIEAEGLCAFRIYRLMTEQACGVDVQYYETRFLRENKISERPDWFNAHSNSNSPYGSPEYKMAMMKAYGAAHPMHSPVIRDKVKETLIRNYGVDNPSKASIIQERKIATSLRRWGATHFMKTQEGQERYVEGIRSSIGVDYPQQSPMIRDKTRRTNLERYGVEYPQQSQEVRKKFENTMIDRYGVPHPMQSKSIRDGAIETSIERYGTDPLSIARNIFYECPHCGESGYGPNMPKHHMDRCIHNPNREPIQKVTCPHCNMIGDDSAAMQKWHFDRCAYAPGNEDQLAEKIRKLEEEETIRLNRQVCPHCGTTAKSKSGRGMNRWHFDNCKMNPMNINQL